MNMTAMSIGVVIKIYCDNNTPPAKITITKTNANSLLSLTGDWPLLRLNL